MKKKSSLGKHHKYSSSRKFAHFRKITHKKAPPKKLNLFFLSDSRLSSPTFWLKKPISVNYLCQLFTRTNLNLDSLNQNFSRLKPVKLEDFYLFFTNQALCLEARILERHPASVTRGCPHLGSNSTRWVGSTRYVPDNEILRWD